MIINPTTRDAAPPKVIVDPVKLNTRNIMALAEAMKAQAKQITELQAQVQTQARSIETLGNDLSAARIAMANAAATMGTGPTVRQ